MIGEARIEVKNAQAVSAKFLEREFGYEAVSAQTITARNVANASPVPGASQDLEGRP